YSDDADYELSIVDAKGAKVDPEDLVAYDVLTAKVNPFDRESGEIKSIDAVLVQNKVEGTITEISSDDFYIGETGYEADPGFLLYGKSLKLDDAGIFYLDANNNIVAFDQTSSKNSNYAVIVKTGKIGGADESYQVKMFTAEGVMETRNLADKVKMPAYIPVEKDGVTTKEEVISTKTDVEVNTILNVNAGPIVVSYKLNTAGEVTTLALASEALFTDRVAVKSSALIKNAEAATSEVKGENREIKSVKVGSTTFLMDDATKFIVLDSAAVTRNDLKVDDFAIYTAEDFTLDQSFDNVVVYDSDEDRYASLIISIDSDITLDSDDLGLAMTKTITELNNAEGDATHRIVGNNAQGAVTYVADPDASSSYTQPQAGELFIPVSFTADNEINKNILVTDITYTAASEIASIALTQDFKNKFLKPDANSDTTYYFGKVDYKKGNTIYFTNELVKDSNGFLAPETDSAIVVGSTTKVMVYDQTKASKYRVSLESPSYMSFSPRMVDGEYPISVDKVKSYYVFAREYNGVIVDVVYYVFADANLAFEPVKPASLPAVIVEAINNEDEVIAE
ncbi:MAG: hypothetical protein PHE51_08185, partial [Eubacteriales bacterium]|nr:hypothetical protein [Eubacteriales bacterium]